ncbi:MAG: hypothetical protein HY238_23495 [Acidobacteria bacterium]|nr:hypothetical protein [Acidobacteriota bacterium]
MGTERGRVVERRIRYDALPSQKRFHDSLARFKGFSGPVGSGKSLALCHEAIRLTYVDAGRIGLIGAPTYPMLRDSTQLAFFEICDESGLPYEFNKATNTMTMRDAGSKILFRSLDEFERLRGTNLAWFGVDEMTYTSEEAWMRLEGRLRDPKASRLCGFGVWTPKGFDWVYRRFKSEPVAGYEVIEAQPYENRHLLSKVPDFYERLKASYDERFFQQEVLGQYLNLMSGQVYYAFDRQQNTGQFELDPARPLIWAWDFNLNPMCSVICQEQDGNVIVLDEIVLETSSTPEVCEEFRTRYGQYRREVEVYGDASGGHGHTVTGKSDFYLIRQFFHEHLELKGQVHVAEANPLVRDRVNVVNSRLRNAQGERRLFVDVKCKETIKDLEQVCYKPGTSQIDKETDARRSHLSDALGYYLWWKFRPLSKAGEQARRLM